MKGKVLTENRIADLLEPVVRQIVKESGSKDGASFVFRGDLPGTPIHNFVIEVKVNP